VRRSGSARSVALGSFVDTSAVSGTLAAAAATLPDVNPAPEACFALLNAAHLDSESMTYLVVAGGTRETVLSALGADMDHVVADLSDVDFENFSAYAVAEVEGGVIAIERSGYADPSTHALGLMSAGGGAAAVARSNIQAHERFGCARDGVLIFDDNEFTFIDREKRAKLPLELVAVFDSAWVDLDEDEDDVDADLAGLFTAMAMVTVFTGVSATAQDLQRAQDGGYYRVRTFTYLE